MDGGSRGALRAGENGAIAWLPTLLRGRPRYRHELIRQPRSRRAQEMWLLVVDASASTRRSQALSKAKGLLAQLFDDGYRQRARLALLTASGSEARWQYQGHKASRGLQPWLDCLGAGGGTPLPEALQQAADWLQRRRRRYPEEIQRVWVLTDGRIRETAGLPQFDCPCCLIDIEQGPIRLGRARQLAAQLNARYQAIDDLKVI
ncbi:VWA domain-containing protein [Pseudomonas sp. Pseusp122]|uniref:vWA domain-containing protein n=1 Tax=unclassified Pseudomonas TaxID=196821 RepID=UPI0039A602A4